MAQLDSISKYQGSVLDDGELTFEEYERAFFDYSDCLVGEGAEVHEPLRFDEADQDWKGSWYDPTGRFEEFEATCYDEYFDVLQEWWNWQIEGRKSDAELVEERANRSEILIRCLQENGIALDLDPTTPDDGALFTQYIVNYQQIYGPCWERATPGGRWHYMGTEELLDYEQQSTSP